MNISERFIRRPVATYLLMAGIVILGVIAYPLLPVGALPEVEFPTIQVTASFSGASPETMASAVATPLERQFAQIPGITQMTSSSGLGTTSIVLQFDLNRSIDGAAQDVQTAIDASSGVLPKNLPTPPTFRKVNPADSPIMNLFVQSNDYPLTVVDDYTDTILAQQISQIPGIAVAYATRPANTVAGDYYDVFPRPGKTNEENRVVFAVADVAGKSIPAAMLMATFQASLKTLSTAQVALPELVANMNRYACSNSQGGLRFTTAFLSEYDAARRIFTYINAGHNNPILRRSTGLIERLDVGGLPLGIQPEAQYESASVALAPGDWLIIFTDGLVEAENAHQDEYGETRLLGAIAAGAAATPAEMLNRLMAELDLFVGNTPQHDDVTCLLVKAE